ncbi:hypothetical protein Dimus_002673 [Dionaea muscipula]
MKILCDVCGKQEASIFCSADEAALCGGCDHRVHYANKLASKHQRLSLTLPSSSSSSSSGGLPMCDICQEKKALLFCLQDRAILCRDCDVPIHTANQLTQKHDRFLWSGIKLSSISDLPSSTTKAPAPASPATSKVGCDFVPDFKSSSTKKPISLTPILNSKPRATTSNSTNNDMNSLLIYGGAGGGGGGGGTSTSTSSISEYLMEMLPGWKVDDFLEPASAPFALSKGSDDDSASFWDAGLDNNNHHHHHNNNSSRVSSYEKMRIWVPQAPILPLESPYTTNSTHVGFQGTGVEKMDTSRKAITGRKWNRDDGFSVPQISPQGNGSKRSRTFW